MYAKPSRVKFRIRVDANVSRQQTRRAHQFGRFPGRDLHKTQCLGG